MLTIAAIEALLSDTASRGHAFSELFVEDKAERELNYEKQALAGAQTMHSRGAGLRLIRDHHVIYTYTNDVSEPGLKQLADQALALLQIVGSATPSDQAVTLQEIHGKAGSNPMQRELAEIGNRRKLDVLREIDAAVRSAGVPLLSHGVTYYETDQRVWIANSEGTLAKDRRVNTRARLHYTVGDTEGALYEWADFIQPAGLDTWQSEEYIAFFQNQLKTAYETLRAEPLKPGRMPVVLAAGSCGVLWHECCGHTLEAAAIASGHSDFIGKRDTVVASPKVTIVDDGTLPGLYGSSCFDDEGKLRQRNVLIEKGVLKGYLCDRVHGRQIGLESNGCGRRQDYTFAPTSRMSNTYLAPGCDDEEEMIRSLGEGLLVTQLGGGSGGPIFSLACSRAYLIKNGQIDRPVKNCMLTGRGIDVMKKIDRVGANIKTEYGSFCGASSGLVPTTAFQPQVRISEMIIGGEA